MQEQHHVAQEMMQKRQRAADERQRQLMADVRERIAGQTPPLPDLRSRSPLRSRSTSRSSPGNPRTGKKKWSKVHRTQLSALGCADALTETAGDETEVNRDDFDRGSGDLDQLYKAQ